MTAASTCTLLAHSVDVYVFQNMYISPGYCSDIASIMPVSKFLVSSAFHTTFDVYIGFIDLT